jgi:hypothetical protein
MNAGLLRSNDLRLIQEELTKEQKKVVYNMKETLSTRHTWYVHSATGGGCLVDRRWLAATEDHSAGPTGLA